MSKTVGKIMDDLELELKEDFLQEATQLLEDSEQAFLALEGENENSELVNQIFRLAHNLKGTSRAVGFGGVAEFTHEFENLILKIKDGTLKIDEEVVSLLLEGNDHLVIMIKMLKMDMNSEIDSTDLIEKIQFLLKNYQQKQSESTETSETKKENEENNSISEELELNLDSSENEEPMEMSKSSEQIEISSEKDLKIFSKNSEQSVQEEQPKVKPKPKDDSSKTSATAKKDETIRVSLSRVEDLNNFVGELVILQTVLQQRGDLLVNDDLMLKSLRHLGKLSKEIQEISMSLRMVPLKSTMQKMGRIVRDTSKILNKKVDLVLEGEETEIDKTVLEFLSDPLVHIIRNGVDHGLGTPEERESVGKPPQGTLTIKAFHEGNNLVIEIKDDGKGINPEIIKKIAIEKEVISANENLTENEIINLIFHPGFSTKEEVTEVSGRGVGMDVVKNNIENLSGEIIVNSTLGEGSIFTVRLPLTLAIIEGMVVDSNNEKFIIPISQITESLRPSQNDIHFITGVGECLDLRGEVIPIFELKQVFMKQSTKIDFTDKTAIVIRNEKMRFAVVVENIINQQQVVIKKLGREIANQSGFMGSAILGDGKPAIIIDLIELFGASIKNNKNSQLNLQENM